ncbi:MAG TPA: MerR family transcriptional regulator [Acidobacteriota bacterium]|nr:MerR family transcriptional regulator [Acidobacteriota bacterium]
MARTRQKLFYKIGEVCKICEIEPHVLRYWETVFSRLKPVKNRAGQRIYRRTDLELVEEIKKLLYEQGFTIAGANAKLLAEGYGRKEDMLLFSESLSASQRRSIQEVKRELTELEQLLSKNPVQPSRKR